MKSDDAERDPRRVPEIDMDDETVESLEIDPEALRAPDDWVIAGPLAKGVGRGRRFLTWEQAERWAREFYGARFRMRWQAGPSQYAFLIRGRGQSNE